MISASAWRVRISAKKGSAITDGALAAAGGTGQLNWQLATGASSGDLAAVVGEDYAPLLTLAATLPATESDALAVPVIAVSPVNEDRLVATRKAIAALA